MNQSTTSTAGIMPLLTDFATEDVNGRRNQDQGSEKSQDTAVTTTFEKTEPMNSIETLFEANPIGILNQYLQRTRQILRWVEHMSKGHPQEFTVAVLIGEKQYNPGRATTKKAARKVAAVECLRQLIDEGVSVFESSKPKKGKKRKFGEEGEMNDQPNQLEKTPSKAKKPKIVKLERNPGEYEVIPEPAVQTILDRTQKSATTMIIEYASKRRVNKPQFEFTHNPDYFDFTCRCVFMDQLADNCYGKSKAQAKEAAAITILNKLVHTNELKYLDKAAIPPSRVLANPPDPKKARTVYELVASAVSTLIYLEAQKDQSVGGTAKVSAGIVITDDRTGNAWVAAWGTGTRTLTGDSLRMDGTTVNDSHAEVLSRRGFLRFIYKQLNEYLQDKETIFDPTKGGDNRLKIRPNLHIHLYINTAPCGDGRVFTLVEGAKNCGRYSKRNFTNPVYNRAEDPNVMIVHTPYMGESQKHGLLRSKIEQGEGTVPTNECFNEQTIDGINGGERLRTMSCSDKILKWNILGLQGTLLALFVQPIYLKSIVIGSLCNHAHIARAVCCRAEKVELPRGFRVNHPIIAQAKPVENDGRDTSKSSLLSANWNFVDQTTEFINGCTGQTNDAPVFVSRLSKKSLFAEYKHLCTQLGQDDWIQPTYAETKAKVIAYNLAKKEFINYLKNNQHGTWISKPREEKLFK